MGTYDVAIIGGGIVGLSAAMYCGRLNLKTILIGKEPGGTLTEANIVENYPGFSGISGLELTNKVLEHAKNYDVQILQGVAERISRSNKICFKVYTKKESFNAKTIIFCTGSERRKLGIPGEKEFTNKGVQYCALCDGILYKDKIVVVVGGGNSAVKEALLLSKYAKKVYIIARSRLRPEPINLKRIKAEKKIEILEGIKVNEIKGNKFVESVVLDKKIGSSNILNVEGVFVDIGHLPLSSLVAELGVKLNKDNEIIIDKESKTNIKGIYAAGDVVDTRFKQAITGVGEAVKAVYSAYEYLQD